MAGRRTNLGLLVVLAVAGATGGLAYATGVAWGRWVTATHGAAGLAVLLLVPWKSVVVRRGLRRRSSGRARGIVLGGLVAVAVVTGVLHSVGVRVLGPVTAMQAHVGASVAALPFVVAHVWMHPVRPRRVDASRRSLLRTGAVAGGAATTYVALEGVLTATGARGGDRRFTGSHEVGSHDPDAMPVTSWFDDATPAADADTWRLAVEAPGETRRFALADLADLADRRRAEWTVVLDCTGGWYAEQRWEGVTLADLLPPGDGRSIEVVSLTGYRRRFPRRDAPHLLVATQVGGEPLSPGHGFPARIVAPGRRGFWWVKWIETIRLSDTPWWWQPPFPLT